MAPTGAKCASWLVDEVLTRTPSKRVPISIGGIDGPSEAAARISTPTRKNEANEGDSDKE